MVFEFGWCGVIVEGDYVGVVELNGVDGVVVFGIFLIFLLDIIG